ncbi:MAG: acyl-[ACP]--phospholipid O-acyltransferase, partial [Gammaproteobacteria bacterium]
FGVLLAVVAGDVAVDVGNKLILHMALQAGTEGFARLTHGVVVDLLIIAPFVLLLSPAGFLVDRLARTGVLRACAWLGLAVALGLAWCYANGAAEAALALTVLLAVQNAVLSPAKYAIIREMVSLEQLARANGLVQAATALGFGIALAGGLAWRLDTGAAGGSAAALAAATPVAWLVVASALVTLVCTYLLPASEAPATRVRFAWRRYFSAAMLRENFALTRRQESVWLSVIGLGIFWSLLVVTLSLLPAYAEAPAVLGNPAQLPLLLGACAAGLALGALLAGRVSRDHIETGIVPVGAFGVALALGVLPWLEGLLSQALCLFALGALGALFVVPLTALLQYHGAEHERGRIVATANAAKGLMIAAALGVSLLLARLGLGSDGILVLLALLALGGALYTCLKLPQGLVRILVTVVVAQRYRTGIIGFERLPATGGVLLIGNHISWIDWALVQMACPRPIRFVMFRGIYERWRAFKRVLDFFGVIPISTSGSRDALARVSELLRAGEVVCMFPEGAISRSGHLGEFKRGFETAVAGTGAVIVPFYLRGLWGSVFSRANIQVRTLRERFMRRDILIAFGQPLPDDTPADPVKRRVFDLSIESWQHYSDTLDTVPDAWLATAKRKGRHMVIADTMIGPLSGYRFMTGVFLFARLLERLVPEQNVGLMLPTTNAGAIANMAALVRGRTVVNLNYTASVEATQAAIARAGIRHVLTSERFLDRLRGRGIDPDALLAGTEVLRMEDLGATLGKGARLGMLAQTILLPAFVLRRLYCKPVALDAPAAIMFSSGSEGQPKGVVLSHRNFMANLKQIYDVLNTEDSDVVMATLPQFHAFGLTVTTFMPLTEGVPVVCHPDPTDAVNVAKAIATYHATLLFGTSTFLRLYAKNPRVHPLMLSSIRIVVAGAEKLSDDVRDAFKLKFTRDIYEGYGATETTPVASTNIPDRIDTTYWTVQIGNKPGTVGMPLPGTSFRIVDPDTLEELPTGSDGLILIGGAQVMLGYLDDLERTAQVICELDGARWYKTGDKGHLDADGFLTIVDRYSRFAKLGGEMISLTAVEDQVRRVLGEIDCELVAVNLPDGRKGEQIVLLVAGEGVEPEALRRVLVERGMHPLMLPASVHRVTEVPKLGSGKTDFAASRRLAVEVVLPVE